MQGEEKVSPSGEKVSAEAGGERGGRDGTLQLCDSEHCRIFTASATVPETDPALLPSLAPSSHLLPSLLLLSLLPVSPPSVVIPPPLPVSPPPPSSSCLIRIMSSLAPPTSCTQRPRSPWPEEAEAVVEEAGVHLPSEYVHAHPVFFFSSRCPACTRVAGDACCVFFFLLSCAAVGIDAARWRWQRSNVSDEHHGGALWRRCEKHEEKMAGMLEL